MIGAHIQAILIVTGALTAGALLQFIAPIPTVRMIYGEAPTSGVGVFLARHWGLLIFLIGVLLIYAAYHPGVRDPATLLAAIERSLWALASSVRLRWQSQQAIRSSR